MERRMANAVNGTQAAAADLGDDVEAGDEMEDTARLLKAGKLSDESPQAATKEVAPSRDGPRDVWLAARIFFWHGLLRRRRWLWPALLTLWAVGYEVAASFVMKVLGDFYLSISERDAILFVQVLWRSLLVTAVVASLKAARDFAQEMCAARWRHQLTRFLHRHYLSGVAPYRLATASGAAAADNADQRIASDAAALTDGCAEVVRKVLVIPGLLFYYTWYLTTLFGWTAPAACYLYFAVSASLTRALLRRVVPLVYLRERAEGTFRYDHAWLRACAEPVAFGGAAAASFERRRLGRSLAAAVAAQRAVAVAHLPLYLCTQFSEYLGSIVNYAAVGGAILWLSKAEGASEAEISSLIARGSFSCLYLIDAFSQALEAASAAATAAGSAGRVVELLERCGIGSAEIQQLSPLHYGESGGEEMWDLDRDGNGGGGRGDVAALPLRAGESKAADLSAAATAGTELANANVLPRPYSPPSPEAVGSRGAGPVEALVMPAATAAAAEAALTVSCAANGTGALPTAAALLRLIALSVATPGTRGGDAGDAGEGSVLVSGLTLEVAAGDHLLICGPSGSGKTSLLRVLAGIWEPAGGSFWFGGRRAAAPDAVPAAGSAADVMFLAQRPYCFRGTLLEQLAYPWDPAEGCCGSCSCRDVYHVNGCQDGCHDGFYNGLGVTSASMFRGSCLAQRALEALAAVGLTHLLRRGEGGGEDKWKKEAMPPAAANSCLSPGPETRSCSAGSGSPIAPAAAPAGRLAAAAAAAAAAASPAAPAASACAAAPSSAAADAGLVTGLGLANTADWATQLSPGEMQRLGLARILLRRPQLAFLDESTSAIDEAAEAAALAALQAAGVTLVSIGHRPSLRQWHSQILRLGGPAGAWELERRREA